MIQGHVPKTNFPTSWQGAGLRFAQCATYTIVEAYFHQHAFPIRLIFDPKRSFWQNTWRQFLGVSFSRKNHASGDAPQHRTRLVMFWCDLGFFMTIRDYSVTIWDYCATIRSDFVTIQDYFIAIIRDYLEDALMNLIFHIHVCNSV